MALNCAWRTRYSHSVLTYEMMNSDSAVTDAKRRSATHGVCLGFSTSFFLPPNNQNKFEWHEKRYETRARILDGHTNDDFSIRNILLLTCFVVCPSPVIQFQSSPRLSTDSGSTRGRGKIQNKSREYMRYRTGNSLGTVSLI